MSSDDPNDVWQDREIHFDLPMSKLRPRRNEVQIDSINSVEDTKGNNGEKGELRVTNLRLIWISHREKKTNLSIGYSCIVNTRIGPVSSRQRGNTQGLHLMTKQRNSRFEFIFTSLVPSPRLFTTVQVVFRSYETTKLYRNLKLRGAIIQDKHLIQLPNEEIFNKVDGVWNLSSDQGNLGTFFVTNVRLVWHANLAENFNVSIPWIQITSIRVRDSKFGHALVVETTSRSGGYILGFRVDPHERLQEICKEISTLHEVYASSPVFGIKWNVEDAQAPPEESKAEYQPDDTSIVAHESHFDTLAVYYADGDKNIERDPEYNGQLGLAVEKLREGVTIDMLWNVQ